MKSVTIALAVFFALGLPLADVPAQHKPMEENLDSLSQSFRSLTRSLTTPEFERRKQVLRLYQRRGYVQVLYDVVAEDGLSALLSLLKVNAQIAYHLPHDRLVIHIPPAGSPQTEGKNPWHFLTRPSQPFDVALTQEWTFPEDPWRER
jgi:hypothetical protein